MGCGPGRPVQHTPGRWPGSSVYRSPTDSGGFGAPAEIGYHRGRMLKSVYIKAAAQTLEDRLGLDSLWLYGPAPRGWGAKRSDLTLAALFRRPPRGMEVLEATLDLATLLCRNIDLVDLERAAPTL